MFNWLKNLGHSISSLFIKAVDVETGIFDAYFSIKDDIEAALATLRDFQRFEMKPLWKSRVISVPRVVENVQEITDIIVHGFRDKFQELHGAVHEIVNLVGEQRGPPPDDGAGGIADVQSKMATIKLATIRLKESMHVLLNMVQMLDDLKQRFESLSDLFLPQGSTKKTVDEHYRKRQSARHEKKQNVADHVASSIGKAHKSRSNRAAKKRR